MMRRSSNIISKYVLQAILPYFGLIWLLLSVILFVQQSGRHSELLFSAAIPNYLIWELTIALIPNVIAFTCPVAALVGVIIGLSRMQGDSEMVALRAAGVGKLQIAVPVILLGAALSAFAFFINLKGVPFAAQIVRRVVIKAALHKLESPVEPGTFNTEITDFTIFVRNGNDETGNWENVFIYHEPGSGSNGVSQVRLITAKEGRIDSGGDDSEIVLSGADVTTLEAGSKPKIASERVRELRLVVKTKRAELVDRLSQTKETPEEMGLLELARYADTVEGSDRTEAQILWQRRILLSITPLLFALLGTSLVAKFSRGGRGFGILLALISLVIYYLLTLLGEQLARTGAIIVATQGLIPLLSVTGAIVWLSLTRRFSLNPVESITRLWRTPADPKFELAKISPKSTYIDFTTGLLDLDLAWNLVKNYVLTLSFLTSIYMIFTAFELWKFAGTIDNGVFLLLSYQFYLIPFVYIQLAPSALMIATLATYIIKSRQNEIVTWTAAGQSIYRLLLPCFVVMIVVGFANLGLQEWVLTSANIKQDALRDQIRSLNASVTREKKYWVAGENKIYSFGRAGASDNENKIIRSLSIFEFHPKRSELKTLTTVDKARWINGKIEFLSNPRKYSWQNGEVIPVTAVADGISAAVNPFRQTITKPSHLNIPETLYRAENSESENERRTYLISLHKKYSTPFLPFIITLFTAPFALSLSRKGNVLTLGYAVAIWLLFMGVTNVFEQFGANGYIAPWLSVWGPLIVFTTLGGFLVTKIKT